LIDEDFCCREHREKYLSSFRRAINQLPDLVVTPAAAVSEEPVPHTAPVAMAADPRVADFLPTAVTPGEGPDSIRSAAPDTMAACCAMELPRTSANWSVDLELEQRPAELLEPIALSASAVTPEAGLLAPTLSTSVAIAHGVPSLEDAGLAAVDENGVAGESAPCACAELQSAAPFSLVMPSYSGWMSGAPCLDLADAAGLVLLCGQVECAAVAASEIALAHEYHLPSFTVSTESMQLDQADADAMSVPESAPALAMSSLPIGHISSQPASSPVMIRPTIGLSSPGSPAQLSVPALSSGPNRQPSLAPEAAIPDGQAANPAAGPISHEAVRPSFWSSVRIKNWRLRITFAKPA
jgi:hypothetical protein